MKNPARLRSTWKPLLVIAMLTPVGCQSAPEGNDFEASIEAPTVPVIHPPLEYRCLKTPAPPEFEGELDMGVWSSASWTSDFRDIEGTHRPIPHFRTKAKMLWDDDFLYVACAMEEPDLWATYDQRDMIVFHENDFEVFIDPDGDENEYYEIEINILGTIFDLFLQRPYRRGGPAEHGWNADGLRWSIHPDGTINDPGDLDRGWVLEMAIPFVDLRPPTLCEDGSEWNLPPITEHRRDPRPVAGETWRINFSRVQWDLEVVDGVYRKVEGRPEYNWTWTPQWEINMHVPSRWGFLEFVDE